MSETTEIIQTDEGSGLPVDFGFGFTMHIACKKGNAEEADGVVARYLPNLPRVQTAEP